MNEDVAHDLQEIVTDLRELKTKQQVFYEDVNQKRNKIKTEIQKFKEQLIQKAEDLEKASLKELDKRTESITIDLNHDIERVNKMLQEVEKDLGKANSKDGNEAKRFVDLKLAKRRMSKRADSRTELFGKPLERMEFTIHSDVEKYFKEYESLGSLSGK